MKTKIKQLVDYKLVALEKLIYNTIIEEGKGAIEQTDQKVTVDKQSKLFVQAYMISIIYKSVVEGYDLSLFYKSDSNILSIIKILYNPVRARWTAHFIYMAQQEGKLQPFEHKRIKSDMLNLAKRFGFKVSKSGSSRFYTYYSQAKKGKGHKLMLAEIRPIVKKLP